mmetsp:Transcript_21985/g.69391  ORF Transcript_21985/g.69391 Transcript_21985/m.69391 type:complete len:211 (-) Transcript_21985:291-923(-)
MVVVLVECLHSLSLFGRRVTFTVGSSPILGLRRRVHLGSDLLLLQRGLRVVLVILHHVCAVAVVFLHHSAIPTTILRPNGVDTAADGDRRQQLDLFPAHCACRSVLVPCQRVGAISVVALDNGGVPAVLFELGLHQVADPEWCRRRLRALCGDGACVCRRRCLRLRSRLGGHRLPLDGGLLLGRRSNRLLGPSSWAGMAPGRGYQGQVLP